MMPKLNPCQKCGSHEISKTITLHYIEFMCLGCGTIMKMYPQGKTRVYDSIGNCARYLMPKAIEAWNRRVNDE